MTIRRMHELYWIMSNELSQEAHMHLFLFHLWPQAKSSSKYFWSSLQEVKSNCSHCCWKGNFAVLLLVSIWNFSYLDQEKAITVNQLLTVWGFVDIFISGMPWAITNCVPSNPVHDSVLLTVSGILAILQQQQQKDKTSKIIIQSDNKLSFKWSFQHFPCNEVFCSSWIWLIQKSLLPLFVVLPLNVLVLSLPIS